MIDEYEYVDPDIWREDCIWCGEPINMEIAETSVNVHEYCLTDLVEHVSPSKTVVRTKKLQKISNIIKKIEGNVSEKYTDRLKELIGEAL